MQNDKSDDQNETATRGLPPLSRRTFLALGAVGVTTGLLTLRGVSAWGAVGSAPATARPAVPNRAPLRETPFSALPLGSVRARGWLLHQLELQRDGLTGHAEEILPGAAADSAWLGGKGEGWEKGPYYVKGLVALAYTLDDTALKAKAQTWVEAILRSQRPDGSFGPGDDWWPRMVATYLLRDYAEATGDPRVVPMLSSYHRYMAAQIAARPLQDWGRARAGDQIDTIFWLYNRTGDAALLSLADTLHQQAYPWREIFTENRFLDFDADFQPRHAVNVPQALKMPAVYWQRSQDPADRDAFHAGHANLTRDHGLAVGMPSGTEFLAGRSPTQGIELCSIVERMLSDETALRILGDAAIGDHLELVAFNALPAATTKSIRQHVYFTLPNNVSAHRGGMGYNQDYDDARTPAPRSGFPCCCYNFHMGWPKLAQNSWAASQGGGLAVLAYVPSRVTAAVAGGTTVSFSEETHYPFGEKIRLTLSAPKKVKFPLSLRIPAWCKAPSVTVNGRPHFPAKPGTFAVVDRTWASGDVVVVDLPMTVETVPGVNDSVSVRRGPLLYALKIGEKWDVLDKATLPGFDSYQISPTSAWNYGLILNPHDTAAAFAIHTGPVPANPFEQAQTPITLTARAKRLPDWTLAWNGLNAFDPPPSPVPSSAPAETVTLVPFGAEMLRVTNFPVIGTPRPAARAYRDDFAGGHADGWVLYGGGWHVLDAALRPGSGGLDRAGVKAVATGTHFADFTYDATVSVGAAGNAGLLFRVTRPSVGPDAYAGYYVGLSAETGQVVMGKADGKWTPLQAVPTPIVADRAYRLRVRATGPRLRVFVDDMTNPVIDVQDASYAAGAIGVRQYVTNSAKTGAAFSQIAVTAV